MKRLALLLLIFCFASSATSASIETIKFECPGTVTEFSNRLKGMQEQVSIWTQANPEKADQSDLSSIFAVHLLPETHTMHSFESSCWVALNDFIETTTEKNFIYWNACITSLGLYEVPQFQEINSCWKKFSKDNVGETKKGKIPKEQQTKVPKTKDQKKRTSKKNETTKKQD